MRLPEVVDRLGGALTSIDEELARNRDDIRKIVADVAATAEAIKDQTPAVRKILANAQDASGEVRRAAATLDQILQSNSDAIGALIDEWTVTAGSVRRMADQINAGDRREPPGPARFHSDRLVRIHRPGAGCATPGRSDHPRRRGARAGSRPLFLRGPDAGGGARMSAPAEERRHATDAATDFASRHDSAPGDHGRLPASRQGPAAAGVPRHPEDHLPRRPAQGEIGRSWWTGRPSIGRSTPPGSRARRGSRSSITRTRPGSIGRRAMIEPLIIQSFRNSGAIDVVADRRSDVRPDFMLQTNISAFQVQQTDTGPPEARVVMSARLMAMPRREVVGTTEIGRSVPAQAGRPGIDRPGARRRARQGPEASGRVDAGDRPGSVA